MSRSTPIEGPDGRPRSASYHHGDLRAALVRAAIELLGEQGIERLSLRAVARQAGVSHTAPYHHFSDKRALIAAVAAAGFQELRRVMLERMAAEGGSPGKRLQESAIAAVLFAFHNPDHYRLMFGPVLADRSDYPELAEAARASLDVVIGGLRDAGASSADEAMVSTIGTAAWAMVHGVATFVIDGQVDATAPNDVEDIARQATDVLWFGLANLAAPP